VRVGDQVTARVTVAALDARRGEVTLTTECRVAGKVVVDGQAVVTAPRRSA
jgi:3-hydroxybutyryl-CoA dehydratase